MGGKYRSWAERRSIIRAIIADSETQPLASFNLTPDEKIYFKARSNKVVEKIARDTSSFKAYYALPTAKPFGYVVIISLIVCFMAVAFGAFLLLNLDDPAAASPLFAACLTVIVIATGWVAVGWVSHRNTIRQKTNDMLFARFSQEAFGDAIRRFSIKFGHNLSERISKKQLDNLRLSACDDDKRAAQSVIYLLNYYEFIAAGVLRGDLDKEIIRDNIRGLIVFYYDKCEPYISESNKINYLTYEHLIKIRTHYREP